MDVRNHHSFNSQNFPFFYETFKQKRSVLSSVPKYSDILFWMIINYFNCLHLQTQIIIYFLRIQCACNTYRPADQQLQNDGITNLICKLCDVDATINYIIFRFIT